MARWMGWIAGAGAVAGGVAVMSPDDALRSWRDEALGQPAKILTASALDDALDLRLTDLDLNQPVAAAALAPPLLARWRDEQGLSLHFGPTYADGVRPVHVERSCQAPGGTCSLTAAAKPMTCADPRTSDTRRCYFIDFGTEPVRWFAAVTLELTPPPKGEGQAWVRATASTLALVPYADTLDGLLQTAELGRKLAHLDGLSLADGLRQVPAPEDLDHDADGKADGWRFQFSAAAVGQLRQEAGPARIGPQHDLVATWRVGGADCPIEAVTHALEQQGAALAKICDATVAPGEGVRWSANLDLRGRPRVTFRGGDQPSACVDKAVRRFKLPTQGAECSLELVLARNTKTADRPWRWAPGRLRTARPATLAVTGKAPPVARKPLILNTNHKTTR